MQTIHIEYFKEIHLASSVYAHCDRLLRSLAVHVFTHALKDDPFSHFLLEQGPALIFRVSTDESLGNTIGILKEHGISYWVYPYPHSPAHEMLFATSMLFGENITLVTGKHPDLLLPVFHAHCAAVASLDNSDLSAYIERAIHIFFNVVGYSELDYFANRLQLLASGSLGE